MRIDLGNIAFNNNTPDANGTLWYVGALEGWDAPNLQQDVSNATSRHGGVLSSSLLGTRSIVLGGIVKATNEANFWAAYNQILGQTNNLNNPILLKVHEGATVKRVSVIRGGLPRLAFRGVGSFTFEIPLLALDPLKYSDTERSVSLATGAVTTNILNDGNFETLMRFTTTAIGTVFLTNNTISATTTWESRVNLRNGTAVDFNKRTVVSDTGDNYSRVASYSVWFALQPGVNQISKSGTASLQIYSRDAWI